MAEFIYQMIKAQMCIRDRSEEWTVDKLSGLWDSAPAPSDPDESVSPERSGLSLIHI